MSLSILYPIAQVSICVENAPGNSVVNLLLHACGYKGIISCTGSQPWIALYSTCINILTGSKHVVYYTMSCIIII